MIQQGWEAVLQSLARRRRVAWMVVRTASVVSLDEGVLTIRFPRPGDVKGFTSSGYEGLLKDVLTERFGINVMVRAMSGGDPSPAERRRGGPEHGGASSQPPGPQFQAQPGPSQQPPAPQAQAAAPATAIQQPGGAPAAAAEQAPAQPGQPGQQAGATLQAGASQSPSLQAPQPPVALQSQQYSAPSAALQNPAVQSTAHQPTAPQFQGPPAQSPATAPVAAYSAAVATGSVPASPMAPGTPGAAQAAPSSMTQNGIGRASSHVPFGDDVVPFPSDDDFDGDEIEGSVDMDAASQLTGISLIQRDLGAQIIAEYEE
jgi:hypothetical protein